MEDRAPQKTAGELFGSSPPRGTRERLLLAALDLFKSHGYHAVGLDRLLAEVGVTKTTFYNHFESKDQLAAEALELRDQLEGAAFMKRVRERAGFNPKDMLLAVFDVLDDWFTSADYRGCLFIHASAEFPNENDPIHRAGANHYLSAQQAFRQFAEGAGIADAEQLGREWILLFEGAVMHRLIAKDDDAAKVARKIAEQRLAHYLGGKP